MSKARDISNLFSASTDVATDAEVNSAIASHNSATTSVHGIVDTSRLSTFDQSITVPGAPTGISATVENAQSTITFTPPTNNGGSIILGYTVIASPGNIRKSGLSSPIVVTGLVNQTTYTFTVKANNIAGSSVDSSFTSATPTNLSILSGGTLSSDATYYYRTFTSNDTLSVSNNSLTADVLVVAGGGAGGNSASSGFYGGGGGAGGLLSFISQSLSPSNYTVTIGAGGTYSGSNLRGNPGNNSQFHTLTAAVGGGGGGGGSDNASFIEAQKNGGNGGSGGGGQSARNNSLNLGGGVGGTGTPGQGNNGGNGAGTFQSEPQAGGGGGGAGGAGGNATSAAQGGAGGVGSTSFSSWGAATSTGQNVSGTRYYAGGGGGASNGTGGAAGLGGGGAGGGSNGANGTANTGGGGGNGMLGGSGIIIVRYLKSAVDG